MLLAVLASLASPASLRSRLVQLEIANDLLSNVLPFWLQHSVDDERGGFWGAVRHDGRPDALASKGLVLNARILWGFSAAYRVFHAPAYAACALRAQQYLLARFRDAADGGYFWMLSPGGAPEIADKRTYGNAFVIYGLSEHYRATRNATSLARAQEQYATFRARIYDAAYGGYLEAFNRSWGVADSAKSTNTHIHVLEAFVNLYRAWPDAALRDDILRLIDNFLNKIIVRARWHQKMNMARDWTVTEPADSYGHDIEIAWLLAEAAEVIGNETLIAEVRDAAVRLVDTQIAEGLNADGALTYERTPAKFDDNLEWWPQTEAINAFFNLYELTANESYVERAGVLWKWMRRNMIDPEYGEWFRTVRANGTIEKTFDKIDLWKCPYHNVRMGIQAYERTRK
jgi:mannobiose 2-epimerase